jgi:hypothetical protein
MSACALQAKQEVREYVAEVLRPLYKAQKVSREGYKLVMQKAVDKVLAHSQPRGPGEPFLSAKRRAKIEDLVHKYLRTLPGGGGA